MAVKREKCWLLLWSDLRLPESRSNLAHLRYPEFVGTLPSRTSEASVRRILPPLLLSHAPLSASSIVECGKSLTSGHPKVERAQCISEGWVICQFGRLRLEARVVRKLVVESLSEGREKISWTEARTYGIKEHIENEEVIREEIEYTPERRQELIVEREEKPIR